MTSRRSESECTHTLTDEAAAKLRALAEETSKKNKKKKTLMRSSSVKAIFGSKEEEGSASKAKKSSKKDKTESSRKTRKAKRSNSISSPYSKRRERSFAKSENVDQEDEEEDEEEEACELTPYLNVNARGFRKEKMMFAIQVLEVKGLSEESVGKRFTLSWRRGVKKENSGKTPKSFCSVTGVIQLNKLVNCMCSMKVSHDANQYQEKSMAFVLRKEGKNKLQVVGSAVIDLAKFASAQHKTHTTTVALSKSGGGPVVANLLLEIAALQAGGDTGDSRKKRPLKKRRSIIISNNEALDKLMEEEAKRAEETGQFTDTVFSDTSSIVALSEASGDEQEEVPFTGFDMVISAGSGTKRSKRRSLILPLKKEDVVEEQDLKDVEVEVKKQRMKLIPLEVVGIPTEEDALEAEEQRRKRREAEAALRKAEAEERAKKEHELFVAMQRYEIQQMRAEAALIRYDTEQRQKLLDTVERLKGIIAKLTRERQEGEMAAQRAMEETKGKLELVTSQLESVKEREKEKAKAVGDLEMQLTRGVALTGTLEEEKSKAKKELEDLAAKAEVERKGLEDEAAALRQELEDQQALHREALAKVAASLTSAESRVTELEAELESGQRQQSALQDELARVKALLTSAEEDHKAVTKTLYATESDLSGTVAALKGAQAEVLALQSSTSDVGMELARAKATLAKREEEILSSGKIATSSKQQLEGKEEELSLKKKEIEELSATQRESCAALDDANARVARLEAELAAALASAAAAVLRASKAEDDARERKKESDDAARGLEQATKKTNEQEEALKEVSLRAENAEEELQRAQDRLLELEQAMKQEQADRGAEQEVVVAEKAELQRQVERERETMEGKVAELAASYAAMEELKGQFAQMSEQQTAQCGELQRQRGILEESLSSVKVEAGDWKSQYEAQVEAVAAVTARVATLTVEKEQAAKELAEANEEVGALKEKEKVATEALAKAKAEQEEQQQIYQAEIAEQHRLRGSLNISIEQLKVSLEDVQSQREMAEIAQRELQEEQKATVDEKDELQLALEAATRRVKEMTDELRVKTSDCEKVPVLEKEVKDLKDQAQCLGSTVERLKGEVTEKEEKIEELESTLVVVRTELGETHKQRDEHSQALEEEQRQRALDIEERKAMHETDVEQLRRELDSKQAELEQVTIKLDETEAKRAMSEKDREEERTESTERLSVAVAKAESSAQEASDLREKVEEMTSQLNAVQDKLDDATQSLAAVKAAGEDSSKALIEEQERRSAELEEKKKQHQAEVEALHASLEALHASLEEKKQELNVAKKSLEELERSLANERDISSTAREESATILLATKSELEEARKEATVVAERLSQAGEEAAVLEEQLAAAQQALADATEAKEESSRSLKTEQEARAMELEQRMSEHSETVTELKRRIADMEETLAEEREKSRADREEGEAILLASKTEVGETKKEAAGLAEKLSSANDEIMVLEKTLSAAQEALAAASKAKEETARALRDGEESSSLQFEQHMREHSQIVEELKRTITELEESLASEKETSSATREKSATILLATKAEVEEARQEATDLAERLSKAGEEATVLEEQLVAAQQALADATEAKEESWRALKTEQEARALELGQKVSEHADRVEQLQLELRFSEECLQKQLAELQAQLDHATEKAATREEDLRTSTELVASLETQLEKEREGLAMGEKERSEAHALQISGLNSQHTERVRDLELTLRTAEETLERVGKERDEAERKRSALSLQLQEATVSIAKSSEDREKEEKELLTRLTNIKARVEEQLPSPRPSAKRPPSPSMTHSGQDGEEQVKFYFGDLLSELEVDAFDLVAFTDTLKGEVESRTEEGREKDSLVAQFEAEKAELEKKVRCLQEAKERVEEEKERERAAAEVEKERERAEAAEQRKVSEEERERNALYAKRMEELRASLSMTEFHLDGMEQTNALLSEEALLQQLDNVAMHVVVENIYSAPVGETVTQRKSTAAHDAADVVFRSLTAVPSLPWAKRQLGRIHSAINSCALLSKRNLSALIYWLSFSCSFLDMLQALEVPDLGFTGKVFESGVVAADHISGNEEERQWQALVHDIYALVMELLYDQLNLKARAGIIREPIVPPPRGRFAVARPVTRSDVLDLFRELLTAIHGVRLFMAVARQVMVPAYYAANALVFHELLGKPELCNGEIGLQIKASLSYLLSVSAEYPDSDYQHIIEEAEGHFEYATSAANFLITISNEIAFPTVKAVQDTFPRFNLAQIKHFIDMYSNSGYAVEIPDRVQMDIEDACAAAKALGEMPLYLQPQLSLRDLEQCATDSSKLDWAAK